MYPDERVSAMSRAVLKMYFFIFLFSFNEMCLFI
jgi:hypothetical protein